MGHGASLLTTAVSVSTEEAATEARGIAYMNINSYKDIVVGARGGGSQHRGGGDGGPRYEQALVSL